MITGKPRCLACGADGAGEAVYPYDDGKLDNTEPIPRLTCIEAQDGDDYKLLILCHDCWHRLEGDNGPDMWTTRGAYEALGNPVRTPYPDLPEVEYRRADGTVGDHVAGALPIWDAGHYFEG